jgi:hypothetical protein
MESDGNSGREALQGNAAIIICGGPQGAPPQKNAAARLSLGGAPVPNGLLSHRHIFYVLLVRACPQLPGSEARGAKGIIGF